MVSTRDTRTALEKWHQGISEARFRGYWHILQYPIPEGLFGGWDHTKPKGHNYTKHDLAPVQLRSRGTIEPDCRDDTADEVRLTVRTFTPLKRERDSGDQTTTRFGRVQCLPARKQSQEESQHDFWAFCNKMGAKAKSLKDFDLEGGPRWKEWCVWDDLYVWERYQERGLMFMAQQQQPVQDTSLTDWGYRKVRAEMERIAGNYGIQSWTQLSKREYEFGLYALNVRFENYLTLSKATIFGRSRPLPQCWTWKSGRISYQLDSIRSNAFRGELRWWTDNLYHYLEIGEDEIENSHTSQQFYPPPDNGPSIPQSDTETFQLQRMTTFKTEVTLRDGQPTLFNENDGNLRTKHDLPLHSRDQYQPENWLPSGLFGDDDQIDDEIFFGEQNSQDSVQAVGVVAGRNPGIPPDTLMSESYLFY